MAELSSIAAIKGQKRTPSLRAHKIMDMPALPRLQCINVEPRNKLYHISITEELEDKVNVHYIGYPEKFDDWRSRSDVVHKPSTEDVESSPSYSLACSIKQRLDDSAVNIYILYTAEAFQDLAGRGKSLGVVHGCEHFRLASYGVPTDITVDFHLFRPKLFWTMT